MFQQAQQTDTVQKMKIPKLQLLWDFFGTFQNHKSFVPRLVIPCEKSVSVDKIHLLLFLR